jgi:hypothetical protein
VHALLHVAASRPRAAGLANTHSQSSPQRAPLSRRLASSHVKPAASEEEGARARRTKRRSASVVAAT